MEQLNFIQTLEQLAPLQAAKEHLPQDIITILELLEKADNIPFNQLYSLAEDCTNRYYTNVMKTLMQLLKSSFINRQTILINIARSLKFLELYGNRQAKLWKVLSKYDKLPDHFHDLQVTLQVEFNLLKKATSKNTENLQDTVNLQQTYTTSLCSHVNTIYFKLAQFEKQIQMHCLYPHSQTDIIQLNGLEYDPDIDGQLEVQVLPHANNTQELAPTPTNPDEDSALSQDPDWFESQPRPDQGPAEHQNTGAISEQGNSLPSLEDIPELEEEEEDWEDRQFADADLIDHHNTIQESDRIRCEYSAHFQKPSPEEHHYQQHSMPAYNYYIPEPDSYNSDKKPKQYKQYQNPYIYLPPPPATENLRRWHGRGKGRARWLELHSHRLFGEKTWSLESRIAHKRKKNLQQREKKQSNQ